MPKGGRETASAAGARRSDLAIMKPKPTSISLNKLAGRLPSHDVRAKKERALATKRAQFKKYKKAVAKQGLPLGHELLEVHDNVADVERQLFVGEAEEELRRQQPQQHQPDRHTRKRSKTEALATEQAARDAVPREAAGRPAGGNVGGVQAGINTVTRTKQHNGAQAPAPLNQATRPGPSRNLSGGDRGTAAKLQAGPSMQEAQPGPGKGVGISRGWKRPPTQIQRLQAEQQAKAAAAEEAHKKAQEAKAAREAELAAGKKRRQEEKRRFFKRTRTGQPLMRYRIEKILNELQHGPRHHAAAKP